MKHAGSSEDELVDEYDVYMARNLQNNINLFQFPIGMSPFSGPEENLLGFRSRPKNQKFEAEVLVDDKSAHFDRVKSDDILRKLKNGPDDDLSDVTKKRTLKSIQVEKTCQNFIGVIKNQSKELHMNPLSCAIQFRPCFKHFDLSNSIVEKGKNDLPKSDEEPVEEVKKITLRAEGSDEAKNKRIRESSYAYMQTQISSEAWVDLDCNFRESVNTQDQRQLLFHVFRNETITSFQDSAPDNINSVEDYIKSLISGNNKAVTDSTASISSIAKPKTSSMSEQIKNLLMSANVLSFSDLRDLLPACSDISALIRTVGNYAMLVQGNWVVKSEVLYPKENSANSFSAFTGIPIDIFNRVRDHILWLYTNTPSIKKQDILSIKIPHDDIITILNQFAKYNESTKMWDFLLPKDVNFIEGNPHIVKRQEMLWDARHKLDISSSKIKHRLESPIKNQNLILNPRKRRRSRKDSSASGTDECENTSEVFIEIDGVKVKSEVMTPASNTLNGMQTKLSTLENSAQIYPNLEQKKSFQKLVRNILLDKYCVTGDDLKSSINDSCEASLKPYITDELVENIVNEVSGFKVINKWPQNNTPKPLYAFTKLGEPHDRFRDALIEMFTDQTRVRISHFKEKLQDKFGDKPCETICKSLLKDYCIQKSGMFYLKGTIETT